MCLIDPFSIAPSIMVYIGAVVDFREHLAVASFTAESNYILNLGFITHNGCPATFAALA